MAQAVSFWLFTLDAMVHFQHNPCRICSGAGYSLSTSISSCQLSFHKYSLMLLLWSDLTGNLIYRHNSGQFWMQHYPVQGFCLHKITQKMQIFPIAKWWNTPLTTQPLWSPTAPYYPLTLRPNSGLDCLNNAPPLLNWFHLANTVSGSATCVSFLRRGDHQPHTQETWKIRVPLCLATHLKPIPHGLPYYHLGCCWHSFRIHWGTKAPSPSTKYALNMVDILRGPMLHSVLSTIHPFEATYQGTQSYPHSMATTTEDWKK